MGKQTDLISNLHFLTEKKQQLKVVTEIIDGCSILTSVVLEGRILSRNETPLFVNIDKLTDVYIPEGTFEFINPGYPIDTK